MKVTLLVIGDTTSAPLRTLISHYTERISGYLPFDIEVIPDAKGRKLTFSPQSQMEAERVAIESRIQPSDIVLLLDEKGCEYTSRGWAEQLQRHLASGAKRLLLVIGGPYGFSPEIRSRYGARSWSLSRLTLTHEMARLFVVEQIYRACTILRGEPYHHD